MNIRVRGPYRIVNGEKDEETGEPLSWSNNGGWGVWSYEEEFHSLCPFLHNLPVGGRWEYTWITLGTPTHGPKEE